MGEKRGGDWGRDLSGGGSEAWYWYYSVSWRVTSRPFSPRFVPSFPSPTPPTIAVLVSHTADIPPLYTFKAGGAQQWAGRIFTITDYRIRTGWREWKESRSYRSESHSNQTPYFHWTGLFSNGEIDTAIDAVSNWILLHWFCN